MNAREPGPTLTCQVPRGRNDAEKKASKRRSGEKWVGIRHLSLCPLAGGRRVRRGSVAAYVQMVYDNAPLELPWYTQNTTHRVPWDFGGTCLLPQKAVRKEISLSLSGKFVGAPAEGEYFLWALSKAWAKQSGMLYGGLISPWCFCDRDWAEKTKRSRGLVGAAKWYLRPKLVERRFLR